MARKDLKELVRGTARRIQVTIIENGSAVDISSDTVTMKVKRRVSDSDANQVFSIAGDVATAGSQGIAYLNIGKANSTLLFPGEYFYDIIWAKASDSEDYEISWGKIFVVERVSDAP